MTAAPLDVRAVDGPAGLALTAPLRRAVFIDEQQVPEDLEWDEHDAYARHYVACRGPYVVVAVARTIRPGPATVKVQRVAVRRDLRGAGVGAALMGRIVDDARRDGTRHVVLDAQISAVGFYRRLGFAVRTAPFLDAGIPHVHMTATTGATP